MLTLLPCAYQQQSLTLNRCSLDRCAGHCAERPGRPVLIHHRGQPDWPLAVRPYPRWCSICKLPFTRRACVNATCADSFQVGSDPIDSHIWYYNGTPAACTFVALDYVLPRYANFSVPDLVVTGPNYGTNLGPFVWTLSGTAGAAYVYPMSLSRFTRFGSC
jgi:hypothetical protein